MTTTHTITDLVALTDVPAATIHYYLRNGLLPTPKRIAPNRFAYDDRHVQGLRLIRTLRDRRGLALPMIRRILPELLRLETEEAFLPEIWDRALAPRMSRRRAPAARLLDAASDAFTRRGYTDANVDDICRGARIAKGSFYRHYRSKEELFFAVAESLAATVRTRFAEEVAAEGGTKGVSPGEGAETLARLIQPGLPVFLDLFARAIQGRPGYEAAVRRILEGAAEGVGAFVRGEGSAKERGTRTIGEAITAIFRGILQEHAGPRPRFASAGTAGE
jgi:AcrR family transcriptional regulator